MSADDHEQVIQRLTERLERERRARRDAERIAERGMRELWEANREIERRVAARTAQLELVYAATGHVHRYAAEQAERILGEVVAALPDEPWIGDIVRRLEWLADTAVVLATPEAPGPVAISPTVIADDGLARWQRVAARSGKLLSVWVADGVPAMLLRWDRLIATVDTAIATVVRFGPSGAVTVTGQLGGERSGDQPDVRLDITISAPAIHGAEVRVDESEGPEAFRRLGAVGPGLAMAATLARDSEASFSARLDVDGLEVLASFPIEALEPPPGDD